MIRTNLTDAARRAQTSNGVGTPRKADDKHLVQQIKELDTFHSHTASNVEYRQPAGHTAVVLDQFEDTSQQQQQSSAGGGSNKPGEPNQAGEWNHNQPRGKSAEAVVTYISSQQSHPIVTIMDDRRVRPYAMKPGESAHYATSGTGQMLFHNDDGSYLVAVNNPSEAKNAQEKQRMASLRHVNKSKQKREIKENEQVPDHPHQGETVNTEVRCIADRIEFRAGDNVVGYYEKSSETWYLKGKIANMEFSEKIDRSAPTISEVVSSRYETVGPTFLGLPSKGAGAPKVGTEAGHAAQTYASIVGGGDSGGDDAGDTTTTLSAKAKNLSGGTSGLAGGLGGLASGLSGVAGGIGGLSGLAGNLTSVAGNLSGMVGSLSGMAGNFGNLGSMLSSVGGLGGVLNGLNGGLGSIMGGMNGLSGGLSGLASGGLNGLIGGMGGLTGGIGGLTGGLGGILSSIGGLTGGLDKMFSQVSGLPNISSIVSELSSVSSSLSGLTDVAGLVTNLGSMATTLSGVSGVSESLSAMSSAVDGLANGQLGDLPSKLTTVVNDLEALLDRLQQ